MPPHDVGRPLGRGQYWAKRALLAVSRLSTVEGWLVVAGGLGASWLTAFLLGGAGAVAPHWFYLPVMFAGVRFGPLAAAVTGAAAGLIAGPALPLDVNDAVAQSAVDWGARALFFVVIGQLVAYLAARSTAELAEEWRMVQMSDALRRGLERHEFHLVYQPLISLDDGVMMGAEALVRWTPEDGPPVGPAEFIPVAEEAGIIIALGDWILVAACRQAKVWLDSMPDGTTFHLSVNLSGRQLAEAGLVDRVRRVLEETGLPPEVLMLEVTETALIDDIDASVAALTALKGLGIGLAIDDFGTGHSSLSYAHRFPVDIIKVDQSFVADIETKTMSAAVTAGVINLAHGLGMQTLAEGIVSQGQLALLRSMGCDLGQGFFFDRPGPPEVVTDRLTLDSGPSAEAGSGATER